MLSMRVFQQDKKKTTTATTTTKKFKELWVGREIKASWK
jgi:hypothetical protein